MSKRLFQILDDMNVADTKNGTSHVQISNFLVGAQKAKGGGHVTMGVTESIVMDMVFKPDKQICILLVIDFEEYEKLKL